MKKSREDLASFASRVTRKKFSALSSRKQHEIIAALAFVHIEKGGLPAFLKRYDELHSWVGLDRFIAPPWLSEKESLIEFFRFHSGFAPDQEADDNAAEEVCWEPAFNVRIYMDRIRSPWNAGSILRVIDNFGLAGLIHSSPTLSFDHPRLKKAARGCQRWIPVSFEADPLRMLTDSDVPVIGIERRGDSISLSDWAPPDACILVAGNEEDGISEKILACCDETVHIPMLGFKRSMNVNHALSIVAQRLAEKNN